MDVYFRGVQHEITWVGSVRREPIASQGVTTGTLIQMEKDVQLVSGIFISFSSCLILVFGLGLSKLTCHLTFTSAINILNAFHFPITPYFAILNSLEIICLKCLYMYFHTGRRIFNNSL